MNKHKIRYSNFSNVSPELEKRLIIGAGKEGASRFLIYHPVYLGPRAVKTLPKAEDIMDATKALMGNGLEYDKRMNSRHFPAMRQALGLMDSYIGNNIIDIGTGTGVMIKELLSSTLFGRIIEIAQQEGQKPISISGLDMYKEVLAGTYGSIVEEKIRPIIKRLEDNGIKTKLKYCEKRFEEPIILSVGEGREILKIRMILGNVENLKELIGQERYDTAIMSYILYWVPGIEQKLELLKRLNEILIDNGKIISLEENPFIVTSKKLYPGLKINDLPEEIDKIKIRKCIEHSKEVADAIRNATTPLIPEQINTLMAEAGFRIVGERKCKIDTFHQVRAAAFVKPIQNGSQFEDYTA